MKNKNLIVYGVCDRLGFQIWQALSPHNRVFMKDPKYPNHIPGVYNIDKELYKHPSIQRTYYTPVDGIILTRDDHYTDELMDEIQYLKLHPEILVVNDYEMYQRLKKTGLNLTFVDCGSIINIEDLYFKDTLYFEQENHFWTDIFRYSLFNLKIENYEKTETKVSKKLQQAG